MDRYFTRVTAALLIGLVVAACEAPPQPTVTAPAFMQTYERTPFGSEHFKLFKRSMDPIWDQLKPQHDNINLSTYGVAASLTKSQATEMLKAALGSDWLLAPDLNQQSRWGWSIGFHNNKYVFVFITINHDNIKASPSFPMIPAGIITDAQLAQSTSTVVRAENQSQVKPD